MPLRFPRKQFVLNWLKALLLSPGVLFTLTWLGAYTSTSVYLNHRYKTELIQSLQQRLGNKTYVSIKALTPSLPLNAVTLHNVHITSSTLQHSIFIHQLTISPVALEQVPFNSTTREATTATLCRAILAKQ